MPTFRAYVLNADGRIVWGEWIEADSEEEAKLKAQALCKDGSPAVELWLGARQVAHLACNDDEPAPGAGQ